jgi:hypothetical protein
MGSMRNANRIVKTEDDGEIAETPCAQAFDRRRLKGTNINPTTFLATDFLNHFNGVEMVIEMLPQMPEYFEQLLAWKPRSYREHFARSSLRDARLTLEAYENAPAELRAMFEDTVNRLNETSRRAIHSAGIALATEDPDIIAFSCAGAAGALRALIAEAGSLINGTALRDAKPNGGRQVAVDAFFDT